MRVAYNNFARGGRKPQVTCIDQMAVLVQIESAAWFDKSQKTAKKVMLEVTEQYQRWLSNIVFIDPQPAVMRGYSFKTERMLSGNGANLSASCNNLCRNETRTKDGTGLKGKLLQFIKALPEQNIEEIHFVETPRGEVMVMLAETFGGAVTPYDANPAVGRDASRARCRRGRALRAGAPVWSSSRRTTTECIPAAPRSSSASYRTSPGNAISVCSSAATIPPCWMHCRTRQCPTWCSATPSPSPGRVAWCASWISRTIPTSSRKERLVT